MAKFQEQDEVVVTFGYHEEVRHLVGKRGVIKCCVSSTGPWEIYIVTIGLRTIELWAEEMELAVDPTRPSRV